MFLAPTLTLRHALFLDFDGTLADIAAQPHLAVLPKEALRHLQQLHQLLDGALALVTGRTEADMAPYLADLPEPLPMACEHGVQLLHTPAAAAMAAQPAPPDLASVHRALHALAAQHPELLVEPKRAGVALHYRHAPHLQALCRDTMARALAEVPGMELLAGKCVFEARPAGTDKGRAITQLMQYPPFSGRVPLFVGDDVTDEAGFVAVQALGGQGVKVGEGSSTAHQRLPSPEAVRQWLGASVRALGPVPHAPLSETAP